MTEEQKEITKKEADDILNKMDKELSEIIKMGERGFYNVKITDIKLTDNHTFYNTDEFDLQTGLEIFTENESYFLPVHTDYLYRGKLGKFILRYKKRPEIGMTIQIDITGEFEQLKLD